MRAFDNCIWSSIDRQSPFHQCPLNSPTTTPTPTHIHPSTREIDRLQRHYKGRAFVDSDDEEEEFEVLMIYHDAGLEGDGPHAVVRRKATGAWRCRPPVSVPGYLARKLPLPPPPPPSPSRLRRQQQEQQQLEFTTADLRQGEYTQRWTVTARHAVGGGGGGGGGAGSGRRPQQFVTLVREGGGGGPRICGPREWLDQIWVEKGVVVLCCWAWTPKLSLILTPSPPKTVITPHNAPLEPGTVFVLPLGATLHTVSSLPAGLQTAPAAAAAAASCFPLEEPVAGFVPPELR